MSIAMEKIFKQMDQNVGAANRILEINPKHKVFSKLEGIYNENPESKKLKEYSELLYNLSSLVEGLTPENPVEFASKITDLMAEN